MAFEGHQNTLASSLFHTYQHQQASSNLGGGSSGSGTSPFSSIHSASQDQDMTSFVSWCHDDPRKLTDTGDWDGETDLQGLVSNIVDEADSPESYFNEGILPTCNSIWSPTTLKEELQQGFQFEPKTQQNHSFFSNCKSHDSFRESQLQSLNKDVEPIQLPNGLATNQSWLLNFPNGDNHSVYTQRLPPGLPIPNTENIHWPQAQQSKYDRSNGHPVNNISDLRDNFKPQNESNGFYIDPFYEDHQSSMKPTHNEQCVPEDFTHLASSFQSLMPPEQSAGCLGGFSNKPKQTVAMSHDDSMADQWTAGHVLSKQSASGIRIPQKFVGEFRPVLREHNGGMREQTLKRYAFQDVPDFISETTEFFQQPKSCYAAVNLPNQYQKKMPLQRDNINVANDYQKHHFHLSQIQNNVKLQMQKGKIKMHTSGFQGGSFPTRIQTNTSKRAADEQSLSQIPYFDFQGSMQFQKFDGENGMVNVGHIPQFTPAMYTTNDPRRHPRMPFNSNLNPRFPPPCGNGFSGINVDDMMPANESAAVHYFARRGENTYQAPATANSVLMNEGRSSIQFLIYVDECYVQWRALEKERKTTEAFLMKSFIGKRTTAASNTNPPKMTPSSSIIDQLIVNQLSEQNKVSRLLETIEGLHRVSLPMNTHTALSRHQKAICVLQASFKEDMAIMSKHQQQRACFTESRDTVVLMDIALKDLTAATRKLRTALWCALQMTVPKPVKTQDYHVNKEDACRERCASPCGGYDVII